jgi:3-oxoacyl-[acyl-carrier-protein] synthase II
MTDRRVVITGVGPVSAIGTGRDAFFDGLKNGRSGIGPVTSFPVSHLTSRHAAELRGFDVREYLETEKAYLDRASRLAFAAMSLAIEDGNIDLKEMDRSAIGLILGSAAGCMESTSLFFGDFLEKGPRFVKPIIFPHTYANTTISLLAIEYGLDGYHLNFASGVTSSASAILLGYDRIRTGRNPMILAGGVEALSPLLYAGYERTGRLSPHDGGGLELCSPFDAGHNGMVLGEGAGILLLEDLDLALKRGARIYGEITGGAALGGSLARAMNLACRGLSGGCADLDYISAAANGSRALDSAETRALQDALGDDAGRVPVSSIKPLIGEVLGADGALRTIAALGAMEAGFAPPTMNLKQPDGTGKLNVVWEPGTRRHIGRGLVNSMDPGGNVVCLLLEKTPGHESQ